MEKWRKDRENDRKKKEQESAEAISGLKILIIPIIWPHKYRVMCDPFTYGALYRFRIYVVN